MQINFAWNRYETTNFYKIDSVFILKYVAFPSSSVRFGFYL